MLLLVVVALFGLGVAGGEISADATPEPQEQPRFAMKPVGDFPEGFFDDVPMSPGETGAFSVEIWNPGSVPANLRTYKVNALSNVNGGYTPGSEDDVPLAHTTWVDYPSLEFHLDPGQSKIVEFTVSVPDNTEPGQYIIGLSVSTADDLAISGTETLRQKLGYTITFGILVPGDIHADFELLGPEISTETGNPVVTIPVKNTGNYLVRPMGELQIMNNSGEVVAEFPIEMGSVYGGLSTEIYLPLPEQMLPGDYSLDITLSDRESGVRRSIEGAIVTVPEPADPSGVNVAGAAIHPNSESITFANVEIKLNNGGRDIPATNVTLEIMREGKLVEEYPLATNQVLLSGDNQFTDRYIPAEMWESGTYTFTIVVSAVDPNGGQETILLDEELDATIEVP